jgi:hypothetical protein
MDTTGEQGSDKAGESKVAAAKETVVEKVKGVVGAVTSKVSDKLPGKTDEDKAQAGTPEQEDLGPQGEGGYPYREGGPTDLSGEEIAPQGEGVSVGPGQGKGIGVPGSGGQAKADGKDLEVEQSPPT